MLLNTDQVLSEQQQKVINELLTVYDPEIPVNIYDLGLIYEVNVNDNNDVEIIMTLTAPNCPMIDDLMNEINIKVKLIDGINDVKVTITFDPPWDQSRMSEEAMLVLGWM